MHLTEINSIRTTHEHNIVSKFFGLDKREHFTITGIAEDLDQDGEYKDGNGVIWSVCFDPHEVFNFVSMTTVKPVKELKVETNYKKI